MVPPALDFGRASIAISLFLGVLCVMRIRAYDVDGKEPFLKLFLVALYGGLLAAAASLLGYRLAHAAGFGEFHTWAGFLLFVGPIEEGAKYLGFRATRFLHGRRLDEAADGIVYMAATALGFSLIENFLYANAGAGHGHLLWLRLLLSTPGHILFSFPMGVSHYLSREEGLPRRTVAASFALACTTHAAYNLLSSAPFGILLAPAFLALLGLGLLSVLRYARVTSPFRHEDARMGSFHGEAPQADPAESDAARRRLESRLLVRFLFRPPRPDPARRPRPPREGTRAPDLAFAALGVAVCVAWGTSHLDSLRLVSLHPALSHSWQDSTMSFAYPKGWALSVWTAGDGRQVSVNLEAQGHAAMVIRSQAWEVVPGAAAEAALGELLGGLAASERARRPLVSWGQYAGAGSELDMRSEGGRDIGVAVFAHSGQGRSFLALELVEGAYREPLRPGMELVRRTLRLKLPKGDRPRPAPAGARSAAGSPAPDSLVTRVLRILRPGGSRPESGPGGPPEPARNARQAD